MSSKDYFKKGEKKLQSGGEDAVCSATTFVSVTQISSYVIGNEVGECQFKGSDAGLYSIFRSKFMFCIIK